MGIFSSINSVGISGSKQNINPLFKAGDKIIPIDKNNDGIPDFAYEFLCNNEEFRVKKINQKGRIDIGAFKMLENGKRKVFYFSSSRFLKIKDNISPFDTIDDVDILDETEIDNGLISLQRPFTLDDDYNLLPPEIYFYIVETEDRFVVFLTPVTYFNEHNMLDENFTPNGFLSRVLDVCGINPVSVGGSIFVGKVGSEFETSKNSLLEIGFVENERFTNYFNILE